MNRTFKPNRQGITLLFVISMIVLFLLMGTAFVIVANNFNKASDDRIYSNLPEGKGSQQSHQLLEDAIFQLIRGTDLGDIDSPLRVNDFLSDQYGFGRKAYVAANPMLVSNGAFLEITLKSSPDPSVTAADGQGIELLTGITRDFSTSGLGNSFGGRVLSFTSGPAKGFSTRIYADSITGGVHTFRIPTASVSGDLITATTVNDLFNSEVIINGHDFSGTGANVFYTGLTPTSLGPQALLPNRVGQSHSDLISTYLTRTDSSDPTNPMSWESGINEPWDAADISTMFLSGFNKNGQIIPSFFRVANLATPGTLGASASFHAFDVGGDNRPDVDATGSGVNDSFWMDIGSSIITNRDGKRFKPLFAFHIKDMDGLLNVNAHSNWTHTQTDGFVDLESWTGTSPLGLGMGTAEINLRGILGNAELTALLNERYSGDPDPDIAQLPGDGLSSFRSRAKLFGYPNAEINPGENEFGTIGGLYGTAMDIYGRFRIGSPISANSGFDDFSDLNFATFNNGLPQINMLSSQSFPKPGAFTDEFTGNPYEMSLSGQASGDNPFTPVELERVIRPNGIDSRVLPDRLSRIIGRNNFITTDSFDVPMLSQDFVVELLQNISQRNTDPNFDSDDLAALITLLTNPDGQFAFAPELFRGLKMDINRPFDDGQDNNDNGTVGEPTLETTDINLDATGVLGNETAMNLTYGKAGTPRQIYARHLYMLAMLLLEPADLNKDGVVVSTADATIAQADPERLAFAKAMAQWAVNVVDFRDPDSIHTKFSYDPFPWDANGWNPPLAAPVNGVRHPTFFVWGAERPELLLTETLAVHIQNMQTNSSGSYEQRLRPEPFAYFEVYNPWTQNRLNQQFDRSLYTRFGVDLGRTAPDDSPVWRFEVQRAEAPAVAGDPIQYKPLRYVYMTDPTDSPVEYDNADEKTAGVVSAATGLQVPDDIEVFFNSGGNRLLRPGRQALIGTKGFDDGNKSQVFMGRRTDADDTTGDADDLKLDETTRLAITAGNLVNPGTVERYTGNNLDSTRSAMIMFVDKSTTGADTATDVDRKFSLSDPYEGYPDVDNNGDPMISVDDGFTYTVPYPTTRDEEDGNRITAEDIAMIRSEDGVSKNFRYVRLQRLANPLIPWNVITNPYLTIDTMEVDLVSINGAAPENTAAAPPLGTPTSANNAVSHEKGDATRSLWGFQRSNIRSAGSADSLDHHYAGKFSESLGQTNDSFAPGNAGSPFSWLTWNNRPFVSHMEIMNVPYLAPDRLTYAPETVDAAFPETQPFTIDDTDPATANPYTETRAGALAGRYGHLLNFFAGDDGTTNSFSDVYKLLDFIEVPSRFAGNESYYLASGLANNDVAFRHPFNTISRYRAPGKININTIPPTSGNRSAIWDALIANQVLWSDLENSIYGPGATPTGQTDFENPVRPAGWANLVPGAAAITNPSACTLMRPVQGTTTPLFDFQSTAAANNSSRSAAFRNSTRTRLGNLVTTKSSVFACWITVGYFEVDEDGELVDTTGAVLGLNPLVGTVAEIGAETGEQVRNRAFFMFDRSIPVAFEPGKNHNVEKAILLKSLID